MNTNYNVVVVGAGPIGITCATALKAMAPSCKICVIDSRSEPTRNHGLKINADSVDKIHVILNQAMHEFKDVSNQENILNLKTILSKWSNSFIRTSKIEIEMAEIAQKFGVTVLRGKQYKVTKNQFFDSTGEETELRSLMQQAQLVIGADGAHSSVREIIESPLVNKETLQYLVELKYQTDGKTIPRSFSEAFIESVLCGQVDIESMHRSASEENKPVSLHIFVNKTTYDALRVLDENGNLKGIFGNSWNLEEIKLMSKENKHIQNLYSTFKTHLKGNSKRGGTYAEEKISTLEMTIYSSEKSIEKYKEKFFLLVGHANSGVVLERGFNKGLKEASLCAKAVADFFNTPQDLTEEMPSSFLNYQKEVQHIFQSERRTVFLKNQSINLAQISFASTHTSMELSRSSVESTSENTNS